MWDDYLRLALDNITHRKVRSYLTMVGVFIGIMAVVTLISLGQGLQKYIDYQFEQIGGDRILVTPGGGGFASGAPGGSLTSAKLQQADLDIVKKTRGVEVAIGLVMQTVNVGYNNRNKFLSCVGIPTDPEYLPFLRDFEYAKVDKGSFLKKGDRFKAVVGPATGKDVFGKDLQPGGKILMNGVEFTIVGLNVETGNPAVNRRVIIPQDVARELFNKTDYAIIGVKVQKGFEPSDVAERITERLRKHRDVKEKEEDFSVQTFENIIASFKIVLNMLTIVLSGIASISLIVGGVGIMTTMYTSVLERTKQIGIMKSIGARNNDILMIFMAESGILGLVGGIIGVILGLTFSGLLEFVVSKGINIGIRLNILGLSIGPQVGPFIKDYSIYVSPEFIISVLMFSFIVGTISGLLPARRASLMKPVDALRYR